MKLNLGNFDVDMIYHDPIVFTVRNLLPDAECAHFQLIASQNMKRSLVSGFDKKKDKLSSIVCL